MRFGTNKIKFTISCPEGKEEYGGSFEVDRGTTWEEFFYLNFEEDWNGWIYIVSTEEIIIVEEEGINAHLIIANLIDDNENNVKKSEIIEGR